MLIRAVFFDMGGTLETFCHTREYRLKAVPGLRECLLSFGIDLGLKDESLLDLLVDGLSRYHQWRMKTLQELPAEQIWQRYLLAGYSISPETLQAAAEPLMAYFEEHFYQRKMRPEVPGVLEQLTRMGLKIGLISNVTSRGLVPSQLKQYGITQYFNPVVLSSEFGRRKPDPAVFHHAARLANVPTRQCIYVGDRIARDILGAQKAGFGLTVQIHHDFLHGEPDEGAVPGAVIHKMTELLGIVAAEKGKIFPVAIQNTNRLPGIKAFIFDAGDVLYYRPYRGLQLKAFLKQLALDPEQDHTVEKKELDYKAYRNQITQDQYREAVLRLYGVKDAQDLERGKCVLEEEDNNVYFFDGVCETLKCLRDQGYLLGIITDTASPLYLKLQWFERGGFEAVWDSLISSKDIGVRKPDPLIYQASLGQLGLKADETIFVGHKTTELDGARSVGMATVAFNHETGASADYYIDHFRDLLTLGLS